MVNVCSKWSQHTKIEYNWNERAAREALTEVNPDQSPEIVDLGMTSMHPPVEENQSAE